MIEVLKKNFGIILDTNFLRRCKPVNGQSASLILPEEVSDETRVDSLEG
jgi:hypothetical protein